jgi:hypothetical protein
MCHDRIAFADAREDFSPIVIAGANRDRPQTGATLRIDDVDE